MELKIYPESIPGPAPIRAWTGGERALLLIGILGVCLSCSAIFYRHLYQAVTDYTFEQSLKRRSVSVEGFLVHLIYGPTLEKAVPRDSRPPQPPPPDPLRPDLLRMDEKVEMRDWSDVRRRAYEQSLGRDSGAPLGRLSIPSIDLSVILLEGTDEWTLNRAVGHIEGTALPGQTGNLGIAGHRDNFFRGLQRIAPNDVILLTTLNGTFQYKVKEIQIVNPTETRVLSHTPDSTLTLVTCYPFYFIGHAPKRFVVRASMIEIDHPERRLGG